MYAILTYAKSSKTYHFKNIQHAYSEYQPMLYTHFTKEDFQSHLKKSRKDSAFCHPRASLSIKRDNIHGYKTLCIFIQTLKAIFITSILVYFSILLSFFPCFGKYIRIGYWNMQLCAKYLIEALNCKL